MSPIQIPQSHRPLILICIMLALFIGAIEASIVATAMPQIVGRLGGFALYSWVFAAFLLSQTATTVLFGKLADIYGRKPAIIGGVAVFLAGSLLSGFAWSMPALIAFRFLQGLGAGSIQTVAVTIAGDLYAPRERLRIQAWLSGVWAMAAIAGPIVGALILEHFSWSWIFWVNVPVGILTIAGFVLWMHEEVAHKPHSVDYAGAVLFSISVSALLLALTESATLSWTVLALLAATFALFAAAFLVQERRIAEPMISLELWGHRLIARANAALLLGTMTLIGITSYVPVYIQTVQGRPAILAGIPLSAMLFAWPLASATSSRILKVLSTRATLRLGGALIPLGTASLLFVTPTTSPAFMGFGPAIMGFGMGLLNITCVVMIQGTVEWSKRGSATASLLFARSMGNTLGVTALGAILNIALVWFATRNGAALDAEQIQALLGSIGNVLGNGANPELRGALDGALRMTFWGMMAFSLIAAALASLVPIPELETLSADTHHQSAPQPIREPETQTVSAA